MGRGARAKRATRVKLEKADFFELMAALRLQEVVRLEAREKAAQVAEEYVRKEMAAVGEKGKALTARLATKYGFDATRPYRFDEATCELIPVETPSN
jgi:hypothetical protein